MSKQKTWEDVAAASAVDYFLRDLEKEIERLKQEITEIYPELGRQTYRYQENPKAAWPVEQRLKDISSKDAEITRIHELHQAIIRELRRMAEAA